MKLKLTQKYNNKNMEGAEIEILDIKRDDLFSSGFAVLAALAGRKETWLTIDWFVAPKPQTPRPAAGKDETK